jgi:DNA-binding transcriptional MerR regulator
MSDENPKEPQIPDKLYFKIGEVSSIAGLPPHVLRFWETEFSRIRPKRSPSGQRLYRKRDVMLILEIKHLLHHRKFTIPGARQYLNARPPDDLQASPKLTLEDLRNELLSIRKLLED